MYETRARYKCVMCMRYLSDAHVEMVGEGAREVGGRVTGVLAKRLLDCAIKR